MAAAFLESSHRGSISVAAICHSGNLRKALPLIDLLVIFGMFLIWGLICAIFPKSQDGSAPGADAVTGTGPGAGAGAGTGTAGL